SRNTTQVAWPLFLLSVWALRNDGPPPALFPDHYVPRHSRGRRGLLSGTNALPSSVLSSHILGWGGPAPTGFRQSQPARHRSHLRRRTAEQCCRGLSRAAGVADSGNLFCVPRSPGKRPVAVEPRNSLPPADTP